MLILYVVTILLECLQAAYLYDEDDPIFKPRMPSTDELEFEPILTLTKDKEKMVIVKNINCEDFAKYAMNCTYEAALMYNSSKKSPPMPAKISDWCKAIRHLTNCAIDWNSDCKDVTDSHFNEESIRGHMHVLTNICDDEWFLSRYDVLPGCIDGASDTWESCYTVFKTLVDEQKNTTHEWTHFDTHFHMCCARAQFRRCTLDSIFDMPEVCPYEQAVTLQKFSVIVSEGDVYQSSLSKTQVHVEANTSTEEQTPLQCFPFDDKNIFRPSHNYEIPDCDANMMYTNCPGGDPRPSGKSLSRLMNMDSYNIPDASDRPNSVYCVVLFAVVLCSLLK